MFLIKFHWSVFPMTHLTIISVLVQIIEPLGDEYANAINRTDDDQFHW